MARWIDCTVDSMFTTTPFFLPRDGCDPRPTTLMAPSGLISPTIATTLDVPMSRPTIKSLSPFFNIAFNSPGVFLRWPCSFLHRTLPTHRKPIAVAQIHSLHRRLLTLQGAVIKPHEAQHAAVRFAAPQRDVHAVTHLQLPGATLVHHQLGDLQFERREYLAHVAIGGGEQRPRAVRPLQIRHAGGDGGARRVKYTTGVVHLRTIAPLRHLPRR